MKEGPCKGYKRYGGKSRPRCNCAMCWMFYFYMNPGKTMAIESILKHFSESKAINGLGSKIIKSYKKLKGNPK